MTSLLGAFGPTDKVTALIQIAALVCFFLAGLSLGGNVNQRTSSMALVGIGLGLYLFPAVWNTVDTAFN